ncbi:LOW QUALITY PROTEIN: hypothetical protein TorRG33x02_124450 [Trema orientale]|uniref:Uncharacterized protein n=1 Tax=Trema orientale TaxID=63057 RepID=A0A2P5F232_TREOI|nr:LOW QUALITY PROTEIN: hypothetical protein TorRG33x02_124450 [Trema orientale]
MDVRIREYLLMMTMTENSSASKTYNCYPESTLLLPRKGHGKYLIHIQNLLLLHNPLAIAHYRYHIFSSHAIHEAGNAA